MSPVAIQNYLLGDKEPPCQWPVSGLPLTVFRLRSSACVCSGPSAVFRSCYCLQLPVSGPPLVLLLLMARQRSSACVLVCSDLSAVLRLCFCLQRPVGGLLLVSWFAVTVFDCSCLPAVFSSAAVRAMADGSGGPGAKTGPAAAAQGW